MLIGFVTGQLDLAGALADGTLAVDGDVAVIAHLLGLLTRLNPDFDIVTP